MLAGLRRGVRFRIATAMAAIAVSAFVAPPVAVAFAPAKEAMYCLTHNDHAIGHEHQDHAADHHPGESDREKHSDDSGDHKSHCCGVFCVTALTPELRQLVQPLSFGTPLFSAIEPYFHSRTPQLLYRPPILRLSF